MRICTQCKIEKPEDLFSPQKAKLKNTGRCKDCKRKSDREFRKKNIERQREYFRKRKLDPKIHEKVIKINRLSNSKRRAGLDRDRVIKDDTKCYCCGITQAEHREKILNKKGKGISLSIHHVDNQGRRAMKMGFKPNNAPQNLMILCSACHLRQHNFERDYSTTGKKVWETRRKRYANGFKPKT